MSTLSVYSDQATNLFISGLNDVDGPVVVCDRCIAGNDVDVAVQIYDVRLRCSENYG